MHRALPFLFAALLALPVTAQEPGREPVEVPRVQCVARVVNAADGKPLGGARVLVFEKGHGSTEREVASAEADASGRVRVGVPENRSVRFGLADRRAPRSWRSEELRLEPQADTLDLGELAVPRPCAIRGRVVASDGKPLVGVTVVHLESAEQIANSFLASSTARPRRRTLPGARRPTPRAASRGSPPHRGGRSS